MVIAFLLVVLVIAAEPTSPRAAVSSPECPVPRRRVIDEVVSRY